MKIPQGATVQSVFTRLAGSLVLFVSIFFMQFTWVTVSQAELNENCTVSVLNRTVQVKPDGTWVLPNLPANLGRVRARATCTDGGITRSGQTDYFLIPANRSITLPTIPVGPVDPIPASLRLTVPTTTLKGSGVYRKIGNGVQW